MYIENLLQEQQSLKNKITKAMVDLKNWFLDKIENIKEYFNGLRDRFTAGKRSTKQDGTPITRDVIVNEKVVFKKGTPSNKVWSKVSETIHSVKTETERAIKECKDGIRKVMNHDNEGALKSKDTVIKHIKQISIMGSIILGGVGAVIFCHKRKNKIDDGDYYDDDEYVYYEYEYEDEYDDAKLLGTSRKDFLMLSTSRKDRKRITTKGNLKLLTMSEPEDKVAEVKKTVKSKIKKNTKAKKVDEVKKELKKKTKESKSTRKTKKKALNKNPLLDIDSNESTVEDIKSKLKGLYTTAKRLERQHDRLEQRYSEEIKEIMANNHSDSNLGDLLAEVDGRMKPKINSCGDKLNVTYAEIDRLNDLLKDKK